MDEKTPVQSLDAKRFARQWEAIGGAPCEAFGTLRKRYSEKHRAYHNAEHIAECLAWLDASVGLAERPNEVAIAIFFHDAVYRPGAGDNEAQSAALFRACAENAGVPEATTERIAGLIESTANHAGESADAALLNDIDQAILGSSPARYARYVDEVRREHAAFSERQFKAGRAAFLEAALSNLSIYATRRFQREREAHARRNLAGELAELTNREHRNSP